MKKSSAGLLLYRWDTDGLPRVLLIHPGGPFFTQKDEGHWSIPKGELDGDLEEMLDCARREFEEETGHAAPADAQYLPLGSIRQKGGKIVHAWAFEGEFSPERFRSNEFELEWPPHSGRIQRFPEADRAELMPLDLAEKRIKATQLPFLERLINTIGQTKRPGG